MDNRKSPLSLHRGTKELNRLRRLGQLLGIADPYFSVSDGVNGTVLHKDGRELLNFSSYNYH